MIIFMVCQAVANLWPFFETKVSFGLALAPRLLKMHEGSRDWARTRLRHWIWIRSVGCPYQKIIFLSCEIEQQ